MGHEHSINVKNIKTAFLLNLFFTIIELIGGLLTNSIAILSDALHDLGDSLSLGLSWLLEDYSKKEATRKFTYGFKRFSLMGSLINAVVLLCGSFLVLTKAIPRLFNPETTNSLGMISLAVIGVIVNGFAVLKLSSGKNENVKVLFWHLLEDVLGWIAVLIGSIIIYFTDWYIIDPLLSIGITAFIIYNVFKRLSSTISIFLQATPSEINMDKLVESILSIKNVKSEHHTHAWSLDGEQNIFSTHVVIEHHCSSEEARKIKKELKKIVKNYGFKHSTIELEVEHSDCSDS